MMDRQRGLALGQADGMAGTCTVHLPLQRGKADWYICMTRYALTLAACRWLWRGRVRAGALCRDFHSDIGKGHPICILQGEKSVVQSLD